VVGADHGARARTANGGCDLHLEGSYVIEINKATNVHLHDPVSTDACVGSIPFKISLGRHGLNHGAPRNLACSRDAALTAPAIPVARLASSRSRLPRASSDRRSAVPRDRLHSRSTS
jgi:hypothetical protein